MSRKSESRRLRRCNRRLVDSLRECEQERINAERQLERCVESLENARGAIGELIRRAAKAEVELEIIRGFDGPSGYNA